MSHIFIEALDVWLFRDGRPFAAGSDHRAESFFPPFPSTPLGAIRRREMVRLGWPAQKSQAITDILEKNDKLVLRGPFITRYETTGYVRYHPQPADACLVNGLLKPIAPPVSLPAGVRAGTPAQQLQFLGFGADYEKEKGELLWLAEDELMNNYLAGKAAQVIKASELFMREDRIGIGMNNSSNTVLNGALYEVQFIRPLKDVGLMLEMEGYDWHAIQEGLLQLGGESRAGMYKTIQANPWPTKIGQTLNGNFKVYFATPACFEDGWQPKQGDWSSFFGADVELVSAAIGRYTSIGGFELTADADLPGAHRSSRRFVPAGSVYYFKSNQASLLQDALTEYGGEMGLGQILIKEW